MWLVIWFLLGTCRIRISGGSPEWVLQKLAENRIAFRNVRKEDAFSCTATILKKDLRRAAQLAQRNMCEAELLKTAGLGKSFSAFLRRPLLSALLILSAAAAIVIPRFVFFYEVTGNERVESERILRQLQDLGVGFGTYGPSIHPQELKNRMLVRIPELQWLTVQQNGMRAKVVVRERPETENILDRRTPRDVVAARSGVITSVSCLEGNCLVQQGQAVEEGQTMVSAFMDYGYKLQVCASLAEVYAQTVRKSSWISPDTVLEKQLSGRSRTQISLIAGRKRINLLPAGELSAADCDKMTVYRQFRLPDGILLPLGIEITKISEYDTSVYAEDGTGLLDRIRADAAAYEQADMIAGTILSVRESVTQENGAFLLQCSLQCEEMIARMQPVRFSKDGLQ